MGYCFITGEKIGPKRWKFVKCDGRCNLDNCSQGGGDPGFNYRHHIKGQDLARGYQCAQYCKTYKEAVNTIIDWMKQHPDQMKEEGIEVN